MIEIKHIDGHVMYTAESASDVRAAMEEAVKNKVDLKGADFRGADFRGAYFGSANFGSANFDSANFGSAYFGSANFGSAYFDSANFGSANFASANFASAYFARANFGRANFDSANFASAYFDSANFDSAYFGGANFDGANFDSANFDSANFASANFARAYFGRAYFDRANFDSANFDRANFGRANFGRANFLAEGRKSPFWSIKLDFWSILDQAPAEVPGLRAALLEGRVNGSAYEGVCACLVGTIANVRHISVHEIDIPQESDRPAEQWFMPIKESNKAVELDALQKDTNEGIFRASVALAWLDQWVESRKQIAVALVAA